jgi:hypothetical protein
VNDYHPVKGLEWHRKGEEPPGSLQAIASGDPGRAIHRRISAAPTYSAPLPGLCIDALDWKIGTDVWRWRKAVGASKGVADASVGLNQLLAQG